ncbi:hydroxyethylthiazole kinase [Fictibacillus phosphorivorans]|uniref:hydroxyethylthiazole kinase n=1 Tax=Fictibacillus phosphorivorans TaxID=1221500 RepID=UPI00203D0F17|nr:hydroxyethylthiazole kinase [Fictibacillus phosphorivorans]MCM3719275.1 hydroxyethylthiazole kinase [Fictibacillus phosphorivorans]MCM3776897.1 hydroxyethylthiazole kinase [Fictibacillus phosphorivorans]
MNNSRLQEWKSFVEQVREARPLVHHITNHVTMNFLANGVLAAGGSPMMVHDALEVEDAVAVSDALVLNIGTLEEASAKSMKLALRKAMYSGVPVVLDPVGVGLSAFRHEVIKGLLLEYSELKGVSPQTILTICGNAAEMKFLAGEGWDGRGADGELDASQGDMYQLAIAAAKQTGCIIAMTGEKDIVSDGEIVIELSHGHPMLSRVTGTGCFATSMIALYQANQTGNAAQNLSLVERTALALLMLTKAAEESVKTSRGPGSFQTKLLDELFLLETTKSIWEEKINWSEHRTEAERGVNT